MSREIRPIYTPKTYAKEITMTIGFLRGLLASTQSQNMTDAIIDHIQRLEDSLKPETATVYGNDGSIHGEIDHPF
jgi:hypothetical protein